MKTNRGCAAGWLLVGLAVALLSFRGQIEWLFLLVPVSLILACGIMWPGEHRNGPVERNDGR